MGELIEKLGIDGKILLAQIVNFVVLLVVLYKLLYKPILDVLEKRRHTIEKSLKEADEIAVRMKKVEKEIQENIAQSKRDAMLILEDAKKSADEERQKRKEETAQEIENMKTKVREEINEEKRNILNEARQEIADIVVGLAQKVIKKNIGKEDEQAIASELMDTIKKKAQ